ncbi:hypothetical protein LTR36_005659 [Oleoguttula mirabilis]|uniref:Uncharacterized protein n=1 Tax=Oleoguttula mirabilis TaxID=1507867 RepID=A0AAV9JDW7_9PEZI|nr:hypothetical protein LTR36_005659 [Oleoguttula mirabilis]
MPLAIVVRIFRRLFRIFGWTFFVQYRRPPPLVLPLRLLDWEPLAGWGPRRAHEAPAPIPPPTPPPEMVNLDDAGMPGPAFAGFFDN